MLASNPRLITELTGRIMNEFCDHLTGCLPRTRKDQVLSISLTNQDFQMSIKSALSRSVFRKVSVVEELSVLHYIDK